MYVHHGARLIYLAHARTASTATGAALLRVGFRRPTPSDHHSPLYYPHSPVTKELRHEWTVITTIRNHWDTAVSWAAQRNVVDELTELPWPKSVFMRGLDPDKNSWVLKKKLWHRHLPDADVVLRFETLHMDLKHVLTMAGLQMPFLAHDNTSLPRNGRHYSAFYDDETRDYIGLRFADEIRRLGYTFEDRREKDMTEKKLEVCYCCGSQAAEHSWVGVMHERDWEGTGSKPTEASDRGFINVPICGACWMYEEHRTLTIKAHFFPRQQAERATRLSGSSSGIGG